MTWKPFPPDNGYTLVGNFPTRRDMQTQIRNNAYNALHAREYSDLGNLHRQKKNPLQRTQRARTAQPKYSRDGAQVCPVTRDAFDQINRGFEIVRGVIL